MDKQIDIFIQSIVCIYVCLVVLYIYIYMYTYIYIYRCLTIAWATSFSPKWKTSAEFWDILNGNLRGVFPDYIPQQFACEDISPLFKLIAAGHDWLLWAFWKLTCTWNVAEATCTQSDRPIRLFASIAPPLWWDWWEDPKHPHSGPAEKDVSKSIYIYKAICICVCIYNYIYIYIYVFVASKALSKTIRKSFSM